jgi:iron-sulfur cluster assembly protein
MIVLTESAKTKIKNHLDKRGKGLGIRIGVKTTGCSGLAYVLEFVDVAESHDQAVDFNDFKVFVDPKSLVYLSGMTVDYKKQGLNEGFDFINPNESARCGCGESFTV